MSKLYDLLNTIIGKLNKAYTFVPTAYRLPILYLTGSTEGMSKDVDVTLSYECKDKDGAVKTGSCTLKWQGSSSLAWDKKNYTIKFDNAFEAVDGWGSQKKYCLKANWIDHSHSRNVVSAKLWGRIRKTQYRYENGDTKVVSKTPDNLRALPNAGAIDGFPCIIMLNGEFHGLYAFNIPKDAWMFGMGSGTKEAIVGADNQAEETAFKAETQLNDDGWELEYPDKENAENVKWVKDSLNTLIRACMTAIENPTSDNLAEIDKYLDWESAIDYYIFATVIQGGDMITKNTLLATFDGVKWYFSAYDMDTTYALEYDGSGLIRAVTASQTTFETIAEVHGVFELIKRFKTDELKARYNYLRTGHPDYALSESRICNYFENYAWDISSPILTEDVRTWTSVRGSAVNGIDQICRFVRQRLEVCDKWIEELPAQETPAEDTPINWVERAIGSNGQPYNDGLGYQTGKRLNSSGIEKDATTHVATGFIEYTDPSKVIGVKGINLFGADTDGQWQDGYTTLYDANFVKKGHIKWNYDGTPIATDGIITGGAITHDEVNGVRDNFTVTLQTNGTAFKYIRFSGGYNGGNIIVTIGE